jgi:hypothetical protein
MYLSTEFQITRATVSENQKVNKKNIFIKYLRELMKNILASNSTKLIPINELKLANSNRLVT